MVLVKFVAVVVFQILYSLVFMRSSLNVNNCWRSKISKTVPRELMFIYDELSEFVVIFVSSLVLSAVKIVVSFT